MSLQKFSGERFSLLYSVSHANSANSVAAQKQAWKHLFRFRIPLLSARGCGVIHRDGVMMPCYFKKVRPKIFQVKHARKLVFHYVENLLLRLV